jgi:short-subunit dehydrogenase
VQIPILQATSPSPSILLLSSLAAVVPAPTRSLYGATKAASLHLFRTLALEHPAIHFTHVLPSTVEGSFRASAVDDPSAVVEADPNTTGLKREWVASKCMQALDEGARTVFLPAFMTLATPIMWLVPEYIDWRARTKYNFTHTE